ncbi:MAG: FAD:protein FMN transferase ApbE [Epsilonproteobacteria bacterium]|nr:MAG: FAD:protein FMN transferase ApbE [Campylobacterota bacterium]RLA67664.1 MAG: FAD:protein FMN transferase ApbE [Campylobacterota bacterium]
MQKFIQLIFIISILFGCSKKEELTTLFGSTMGSTYSVKYYADRGAPSKILISQEIEQALKKINDSMSTYLSYSEISKINLTRGGDWIKISPELHFVLKNAKEISIKSDGYFDITLGPLINLWGFGPSGKRKEPSIEEIEKQMAKVGHHLLVIDPNTPRIRKLREGIQLDLSSIAKGFGVDQLSEVLKTNGITSFLVEIGGEIKVSGAKPNGQKWSIGVESPDFLTRKIRKVFNLTNKAIATSGDYRNFFKGEKRMYSHTFDFKTGKPVAHNLASVTVVDSDSCMKADAYATTLMAMGDKAFEFAEKNNLAAFFIYRGKETFIEKPTTEFKNMVSK